MTAQLQVLGSLRKGKNVHVQEDILVEYLGNIFSFKKNNSVLKPVKNRII